jgi:DNA-binding response OmpR family regulator
VLAAENEGRERPAGRATGRVLFLDRDTTGVEQIAGELEEAGLEVLIAHYPEEVGFFLKTPDARKLTAMVCDVMAFRGDQNLLDLFRTWRQDQSNLALLLSFKADSSAETEKAQRIPVVLTAGYLTRPLDRQAVLDAVGMIARRQGSR